jgi:hypothetical protein
MQPQNVEDNMGKEKEDRQTEMSEMPKQKTSGVASTK